MDKIICLVGESGSGKTTIAELLEKDGMNYIKSYTDRPQRFKNEGGHVYVNRDYFENAEWHKESRIAFTEFDGYKYWATKEQYQGKGISVYVIDTIGVAELRTKVKDAKIMVIYLKTDEDIRFKRMRRREVVPGNEIQSYEKIFSRIKHDAEAFKLIECDYVIDNNGCLNETIKLIKQIISKVVV